MKKAIFLIPLLFIASFLLAMPPFPGAGHTHDGSVFKDQEQSGYYYSPFAAQGTNESRTDKSSTPTTTGKKTILVILAAFQDLKFNSSIIESGPEKAQTHNVAYYNNLLQGNSGLTMRKYFLDQSLNKLDLSFKVLGGEKYTAKYGYAYYGKNENGKQGNDSNVAELVGEMLTIAQKDSAVNGVNLDNCTVMIIHAGPGEEYDGSRTDLIWSHRYKVVADVDNDGKPGVTVGGKPFTDYVITPEYYAYGKQYEATIGVLCHEFGHILGLPDSYDTSYDTSGVGQWSLMAGGSWGSLGQYGTPYGSDPAPLLAVERFLLGWLDEEHIASTKGTQTHSYLDINKENKVYTVNLGADQFLLLEGKSQNISGKGMYVPEEGLLITHIHLGVLMSSWGSNTINYGATTPHGIMIVEAVAENYKKNGLGNLWREDGGNNRITNTALFRRDTLTTIAPYLGIKQSAASFLPGVISIIIALALLYSGRRKLFVFIAVAVAAVSISIGCTVSVGTADPTNNGANNGTNTTIRTIGPDTNYYLSTDNVRSKAGNSGITIYNIKTKADGSGSFTIRRE